MSVVGPCPTVSPAEPSFYVLEGALMHFSVPTFALILTIQEALLPPYSSPSALGHVFRDWWSQDSEWAHRTLFPVYCISQPAPSPNAWSPLTWEERKDYSYSLGLC